MWHTGDVFRARGRGRVGRKMGTPDFIPLGTLNLLDSILSTGSSKTKWPCWQHCTHLYWTSPWLYICLHLWPVTVQDTCFQTVPLKDMDTDSKLERLVVPLAWAVKHLQRHMGFTWQKWTWVVGLIQLDWSWWSLCEDCSWSLEWECKLSWKELWRNSLSKSCLGL